MPSPKDDDDHAPNDLHNDQDDDDDNSDPYDVDFIHNLKRLLGIDAKNIEDLIPKLDPETLIDLAGAVTNSDKKAALNLIKIGREKYEQEKFKKKFEKNVTEDVIKKSKSPFDGFLELNVGDPVRVETEDGDEDGTVKIPKGPRDTVGVMIGGKLEMVNRRDVTKIEEGVLGMANIPDIRRMQELAGIAGPEMPEALTPQNPVEVEEIEPMEIEVDTMDHMDDECCGDHAIELLDKVCCMLPNLRLGDISKVRKKINDISMKLNESVSEKPVRSPTSFGKSPVGRAKKI